MEWFVVAEFVVVAKSTAATIRRTQWVEFAPTFANAFASDYNVASCASADSGPNVTTSATPNPARVPLPKSFKEDDDHYDSNLVFKATLNKNVEPTAWSRAKGVAGMDIRDITIAHLSRRGLDEFGLRGLSHGRFTGLILSRNVAETVLLSQLQKKLRKPSISPRA